ncbi:hypothetical protein HK103_006259 [Boothiomyces macroporosus]|uniref:Uncharacterized protein n=1 Tax=Boothiomyces macroporosus TaxID=261099 RepID=A0AAD5UH36_9FUNG|nr:hypothetical protein HK103_006259 [Boothiomyces macroporosus]
MERDNISRADSTNSFASIDPKISDSKQSAKPIAPQPDEADTIRSRTRKDRIQKKKERNTMEKSYSKDEIQDIREANTVRPKEKGKSISPDGSISPHREKSAEASPRASSPLPIGDTSSRNPHRKVKKRDSNTKLLPRSSTAGEPSVDPVTAHIGTLAGLDSSVSKIMHGTKEFLRKDTGERKAARNILDSTNPSTFLDTKIVEDARMLSSPQASVENINADQGSSNKLSRKDSKRLSRRDSKEDASNRHNSEQRPQEQTPSRNTSPTNLQPEQMRRLSRRESTKKVLGDRPNPLNTYSLNKHLQSSNSEVEYYMENGDIKSTKLIKKKNSFVPIREVESELPPLAPKERSELYSSGNELTESPSNQSVKKKKKKYTVSSTSGDTIILSIDDIVNKGSTNTLNSTPDLSVKPTLVPTTPGLVYYANGEGFTKTLQQEEKVEQTVQDTNVDFLKWFEKIREWIYIFTEIIYFGFCIYSVIYLPTKSSEFQGTQYVPFQNTDNYSLWVQENIQFPVYTFVLSYSQISASFSYLMQFLGILNCMGCLDRLHKYCKARYLRRNTILGLLALSCTLY